MALKTVLILLFCCIELFMVQPFKDGSFMTESFDYTFQNNEDFREGHVFVQSADPDQEAWLRHPQKYSVLCGKDAVKVILPSGPLSEVKVWGSSIVDPVLEATEECGYSLTKEQGNNVIHVGFSGCHVTVEDGRYTLWLLYRSNMGPAEVVTMSCHANSDMALQKLRLPRSDGQDDCPPAPMPPVTPYRKLPQSYTQGGCDIPTSQRLHCGPSGTKASECMAKGCCVNVTDSSCYYPMDRCTADGQFVFTIYSNVTTIPVSPKSLYVASKNPCKPVHATDEFATFKFSVTDCGTKTYSIGDTTIYMAEVRPAIRALNVKYGVITRDHPVRLMVECRYSKKSPTMRASTGYMVMNPTVPASVRSGGLHGVQLRIADDETFSSFSPSGHLPLKVLLGRPLYLEVRLNSPKPEATLLVNYCVAYTRSATNALVLLYEGCPNPDLSSVQSSLLHVLDLPQTPYQRRFVVTAFQFMNVATQKYINEEIYFMCSTEVCMPSETPCRKTCFDGKP
ncbi:zona pellucida sperm-binding protein 4 isoform X2 [Ictalurus punctatus]|uniref:Zona pellucida sperm-binding protein 4 isoform X2 n=1 Tax=Ictalurus punctatus TaxID=7998 RepID=A0A2D0RQX3_ICTPU|nr:zona pellucida sperm-binding protein 4 isoform X2 [Ictalurus punctatus]